MAEITATITVQNLDTLDEWLRRLPQDVAGALMAEALKGGGEVVRAAAVSNIHSRSGKTAADLRVEVQVKPDEPAGVAAIGGSRQGKGGRAHILRWLEFGTKAHPIKPFRPSNRTIRKAVSGLAAIDRSAAAALLSGLASGRIRRVKGGLFWRGAKHPLKGLTHPPTAPQSPLTRALAEHGDRAIAVWADTLWDGIVKVSLGLWKRKAAA